MSGPLTDVRVLELSTVLAGPNCARYLADYGAQVIKVEHPDGDSLRRMAWRDPRDGEGLWFKIVNRNKSLIALDLKDPADHAVVWSLLADAHVLVDNMRPGGLERLGLGPDVLHAHNPGLVITRISGFGQDGPYANRAGFATVAEAMSGFAALNGEADGAPLPPPIALTDEVTGLAAAFATMVALHSGVGQVVDVNLLEAMLQMMGPLPALARLTGEQQPRLGAGLPYTVPRGTYRCADGRWVAVSSSSDTVAARVMDLLGLGDDPGLAGFDGRVARRDEVEAAMVAWCAQRTAAEVIETMTTADAAVGPVLDMAEVVEDEHLMAREAIVEVDGVPMQAPVARLSSSPGAVRHAGGTIDADAERIRSTGWD